jgi:hypothetical protein
VQAKMVCGCCLDLCADQPQILHETAESCLIKLPGNKPPAVYLLVSWMGSSTTENSARTTTAANAESSTPSGEK